MSEGVRRQYLRTYVCTQQQVSVVTDNRGGGQSDGAAEMFILYLSSLYFFHYLKDTGKLAC